MAFFPSYSFILVCLFIRDFRVVNVKVPENLVATAVAPVAPAVMSLHGYTSAVMYFYGRIWSTIECTRSIIRFTNRIHGVTLFPHMLCTSPRTENLYTALYVFWWKLHNIMYQCTHVDTVMCIMYVCVCPFTQIIS